MTAKELIEFLQAYVDPDAEISVLSSYYNGSSDIYKEENPVVYANPHLALICADDYYYKKAAQDDWNPMAILYPNGTVKEEDLEDLEDLFNC